MYLIDGYNLLFIHFGMEADKKSTNMEALRSKLVYQIRGFQMSKKGGRYVIVFDGTKSSSILPVPVTSHSPGHERVQVIYSNGSADDFIKSYVEKSANPKEIIVVTSDNDIINSVSKRVKYVVSADEFAKLLADLFAKRKASRDPKTSERRYFSLSPAEVEKWKKVFGVDKDTFEI